ncbi:NosL protein [Anoxybacillus vitaminiphilus]|uniref:NosL protein n=1 Tax=Paranoxybacillus vitaminiphilus TaxID=581036 RepID=A0A327YD36_9BACL|nr:nitrous oxide reductase accessory protein NosL [Anoxybacillus vitaminiphilus]RAK18401.1 NosL protein [Anoxybacillus vitaminiphilus]
MKKFMYAALIGVSSIGILTACGGQDEAQSTDRKGEITAAKEANDSTAVQHEEPNENTVCAFCNMKVYTKEEEMGKFTAKLVKADGETLFFDDIGCMLNYERDMEVKNNKKYVRDYKTYDWVEMNEATVVKADIQTPMKYGFAFFKDKTEAESYVKENTNLHAALSNWEQVEKMALERYNMKKMKQDADGNDGHTHGNNHMN